MNDSFYELAQDQGNVPAEIAVAAAEALNEIVDLFGVDAIEWIRAALLKAVRSFTDREGDVWIEGEDGALSMLDAPAATFQGWPFDAVESLFGPLSQMSGEPLPLAHATSWWQRPLGALGIATRALCGGLIVARRTAGATRQCRECQRALDGER